MLHAHHALLATHPLLRRALHATGVVHVALGAATASWHLSDSRPCDCECECRSQGKGLCRHGIFLQTDRFDRSGSERRRGRYRSSATKRPLLKRRLLWITEPTSASLSTTSGARGEAQAQISVASNRRPSAWSHQPLIRSNRRVQASGFSRRSRTALLTWEHQRWVIYCGLPSTVGLWGDSMRTQILSRSPARATRPWSVCPC
jgi:hypothetical protein